MRPSCDYDVKLRDLPIRGLRELEVAGLTRTLSDDSPAARLSFKLTS